MAVGTKGDPLQPRPFAEHWDGSAWATVPVPHPAGAKSISLEAVACSAVDACTAVGHYVAGSDGEETLAERWNGTAWSVQATPNPSGNNFSYLLGVACPSAEICIAVGYGLGGSPGGTPFAELWNGTRWSTQSMPSPSGFQGSGVRAVGCSSARACTAVGDYADGTIINGFAERFDGRTWSLQRTPRPTNKGTPLRGVACPGLSDCIVVGKLLTAGTSFIPGFDHTLAEHWNGHDWSVQNTPTPTIARFSELRGIACLSQADCVAVGDYNAGTKEGTLIERWDGTRWSIVSSPNPMGAVASILDAVACSAKDACTAVGVYVTRAGSQLPLVERWDGSAWIVQPTPNLNQGEEGELTGVACTSATFCSAVGYSYNLDYERTLAEHWNGTAWAIQPTPNRGRGGSVLTSVACTSFRSCRAVGYTTVGSGDGKTLVERWNGKEWGLQKSTNPPGAEASRLLGVACTPATACTAVGIYYGNAAPATLVERWNGTAWSVVSTPTPERATASELLGVACTAAKACTAVGDYASAEDGNLTLVESWVGDTWVVQATPNPPGAYSRLSGVSCTASTSCISVGAFINGEGRFVTLGESYSLARGPIQ